MPKLLLLLLALVAIGGSAAGGGLYLASRGETVEEVPPPTGDPQALPTVPPTAPPATPPAGQLWRWVNVTVVIPEGSDVFVSEEGVPPSIKPPNGGTALRIMRVRYVYQPETLTEAELVSSVLIDAENGAILREEVLAEDRPAIDQVLQTLTVGPLNPATAPWPYNGEPPSDLARESFGNISFIRPSPDSGLYVYTAIGDPGGGAGIGAKNGRSVALAYVDSAGRLVTDTTHVLPEDVAVFDGWLTTVKLCGSEVQC